MTFYSKEHPLGKWAITWETRSRPWMGQVWNYYEPIAKTSVVDFHAECRWEAPRPKTVARGKDWYLEVRWDIGYYDDTLNSGQNIQLTFVSWQEASFVEQGCQPQHFRRDGTLRDWIGFHDLLFRLFRKAQPEPKKQHMCDWVLNELNTMLNTVRLELIFGQLKKPCLVCEANFGEGMLCDECLPYAEGS